MVEKVSFSEKFLTLARNSLIPHRPRFTKSNKKIATLFVVNYYF